MSASVLLAILAVLPSQAAKVDRVVTSKGAPVEGEVQKESYKEVVVKVGSSTQTVPAADVVRVEYWDAPGAFRGAVASAEAEKWSEAISALASAEDSANSKEKGAVKPRPWFPVHLAYYRALCLANVGQSDKALGNLEKLRKDPAFKENRFLAEAFRLTLEIYREKNDTAKMEETEKEIDAAPGEIRAKLQMLARLQRAESLYDKNNYAEAKKLYETLATAPDADLQAQGTAGVIRSLSGLKDAQGLESYAKKVLATSTQNSMLLIANNALADQAFEKKDWKAARDLYIQSVVRYNPGRTTGGAEREHEKALWRLGACYEALLEGAKDAALKNAISGMASSTFRELSTEYPSGKYREEAAAKAVKYEPKKEEKK
jgi:tetratricopeptide (TPR) repeat protein